MNKNTKILIATGIYPPSVGGPATYSKLLNDELPKLGFGVEVLSFDEVRYLPKIIRHLVYFFKCLSRGFGVDIIFAQDPVSVGFPALFASRILGKRFILKVVGDYAWEQFQNESVKIKNQKFVTPEEFQTQKFGLITEFRRKIERFVAKSADKIIVPSEYLKKIVMMWGVKEEKIKVIYNSFDGVDIPGSKEEIRKELGLNGKIILSAGRLVPWKGFDTLIKLMPEVISKFSDARLLIAGSGLDEKSLKSLTRELGLDSEVLFLGALSRANLLKHIKASDVFVLNTGYEGFSHLLLEVASAGIPIISTDVGGNVEIIESVKDGVLVGYNDEIAISEAIKKVLTEEAFTKEIALNAQKKVKLFTKERMLESLVKELK
jgi:glycosyltransferase involved in cell wall biosynthesis